MSEIELIYGDCFEVLKTIPDKSIAVSFTSPPYNRKRNDKYKFHDDCIDDYYSFLCKFTDELIRVSYRNVFINIQKNYYNKKEVHKWIGQYSDQIYENFIWLKSNPMPANGKNITNSYEYIVCFGKWLKSNKTYTKNSIITSVASMHKEHKAIMHQEVSDYFVGNFTQDGDTILDPFGGLMTTGISAHKFNRNFIGIEKEKEYYEIAKSRLNERGIKLK